jgi:hypothetical protein
LKSASTIDQDNPGGMKLGANQGPQGEASDGWRVWSKNGLRTSSARSH